MQSSTWEEGLDTDDCGEGGLAIIYIYMYDMCEHELGRSVENLLTMPTTNF